MALASKGKEDAIPEDLKSATAMLFGVLDVKGLDRFQEAASRMLSRCSGPKEREEFLGSLKGIQQLLSGRLPEPLKKGIVSIIESSILNNTRYGVKAATGYIEEIDGLVSILAESANGAAIPIVERIVSGGDNVVVQMRNLRVMMHDNPGFADATRDIARDEALWGRARGLARTYLWENGRDPEKAEPALIASFAYGLRALGSERAVQRMSRECGVAWFSRYPAEVLRQSLRNLDTSASSDSRPVLIYHSAHEDHNGAMVARERNLPQLNRFYRLIIMEAETDMPSVDRLGEVRRKCGAFAGIILRGHATASGMTLSNARGEAGVINHRDASPDGFFEKLGRLFMEGQKPLIVTWGCNSGTGPNPFTRSLSERNPDARVWAVAESPRYGELLLNPQGAIVSYEFRNTQGGRGKVRIYKAGNELNLAAVPRRRKEAEAEG